MKAARTHRPYKDIEHREPSQDGQHERALTRLSQVQDGVSFKQTRSTAVTSWIAQAQREPGPYAHCRRRLKSAICAPVLEPDVGQRQRQQCELPSERCVRQVLVGLDGKEPRSGQQGEAQTHGGAADEERYEYLDGISSEESEQSQVQRQDGAERHRDPQDVGGIDE